MLKFFCFKARIIELYCNSNSMVICWFNRHRRTKIRPLFGEKIICLDGRGSSGRWCTTTGSSVVRVTIERRDKSEGSERSASVQSVAGKCIIDFTWDIDIAGYCSRHQTHASWFLLFYASGDLRENIALTMAFWRAWHARGTARETEPRGKMTDGEFEERERIWGIWCVDKSLNTRYDDKVRRARIER